MEAGKKKRVVKLIAFILLVIVLLALYAVVFKFFNLGFTCIFRSITGLECPGCGLTRSLAAMLTFDIKSLMQLNPVLPFYIAYLIWVAVSASIRYVKGEKDLLGGIPLWTLIAFLCVCVVHTIVRNL